jgi:hypothetical protein
MTETSTAAKLFIRDEYFHHHSLEILNSHLVLKESFRASLSQDISVSPRDKITKGKKSFAIEAKNLNVEIRNLLKSNPTKQLRFEVNEDRGVFHFADVRGKIGGFDFAFINHERNLINLRNICYGQLHYHEGLKVWEKFLSKNPDLYEIAQRISLDGEIGSDIHFNSQDNTLLVVGEIQFGNWALAYRDFFKVLKANVQNSIDCLIYVVPTGDLQNSLSDGIVTFENTVEILKEFKKVITVPVWVVGLDIEIEL